MDEEKNVEEGISSEGSTGDPGMVSPPIEEPEVEAVSTGAALAGVLVSPTETYDRMAQGKPSWNFLIPLFLVVILSMVAGMLYVNKADMGQVIRNQISQGRHASKMTDAQMDRAVEMYSKFAKFGPYFSIITVPLSLAVLAFIFWLVIIAFGDKISFGNTFRVLSWAYLPKILALLLFIAILFIKDPNALDPKNPIMSNLGAVFGKDRLGKPLYALFSNLDVFTLWVLWLYAVGFAAYAKAKTSKMVGVVFGLFALYVAVHVGLAFIF